MTTETPKPADKTPRATTTPQDDEKSLLPTVLAFAAILVVAGLLIFWPSGDEDAEGRDAKSVAAGAEGGGAGGADGPSGRAGGVGARQIDAATTPQGRGTRNPAIKMGPQGRGMAPMPEALPKDPPADAPVADKIAFYEKRLEQAIRIRDTRKKFVERLPEVKTRVESSPNPAQGLEAFEKREKIVEDNYAKAQADVEDLEKKLAELRGN
jgi:hypothetical protein